MQQHKDTTLSTFFKLCEKDDLAQTILYNQIQSYYIWKNILKSCELIVSDECTMAYNGALDRTFRDIRDFQHLIGGVLVLSVDFKQTIPVVSNGSRTDAV